MRPGETRNHEYAKRTKRSLACDGGTSEKWTDEPTNTRRHSNAGASGGTARDLSSEGGLMAEMPIEFRVQGNGNQPR